MNEPPKFRTLIYSKIPEIGWSADQSELTDSPEEEDLEELEDELEDELDELDLSRVHEFLTFKHYVKIIRHKELVPQMFSLHEAVTAFHEFSKFHADSGREEKTLSVQDFQSLLHLLLD